MPMWTPSVLSTAIWLDAQDEDTLTLGAGGLLVKWSDKSGNGRDVAPVNSSAAPVLQANAIGEHSAIYMGAAQSDALVSPSFAPPDGVIGLSVFMVAKREPSVVTYPVMLTYGETNTHWSIVTAGSDGTVLFRNDSGGGNTAFSLSGAIVDGATLLISGTMGLVEIQLLLAGSQIGYVGPGVRSFGSSSNALTIGDGSTAGPNRWKGAVGEIIVIHERVGHETRQRVEGYLAHKWGVSDSLPAGHPFKASAPVVGFPFSGNATVVGGGPIDRVLLFEWGTGNLVQIIAPDSVGAWAATPPLPGQYGLTYIADGHQPITHGPYNAIF